MTMFYRPFPRSDFVGGGRHVQTETSARDRFKFFSRPVVPKMGATTAEFHPQRVPTVLPHTLQQLQKQQLTQQQIIQRQEAAAIRKQQNKQRKEQEAAIALQQERVNSHIHHYGGQLVRTVICQTDFRENEAQTDPYTPDYFVQEGKNPEVLSIMSLKWGDGLPAKKSEIEMIDRVRRRKQVEETLPQGSDEQSMKKRLELLEGLEEVEWIEREVHIRQLQETKLNQISGALTRREDKRENASQSRVEEVRKRKNEELESTMAKFQEKRFKAMRKLQIQHKPPNFEPEKSDIIQSYSVNGRRGKQVEEKALVEKSTSANYDVRPTLLGFPEGIQELERTEAPRVQKVRRDEIQPPREIVLEDCTTNYQKRQTKQVLSDLEFAHKAIQNAKLGNTGTTSIQDLYRATPRLIRPDTPTLVLEGDDDEEMEEALILLQRLMRGRAVQNDFFEGKERCHGLIEELQAAQKAKESEGKYLKKEAEDRETKRLEDISNGVLDSVQGDIIYSALDYLHKELTRQRQAAIFEKLCAEAQATRNKREAAEKVRRLAEEPVRILADERFREMQKATNYTMHTYLNGILERSIVNTAYRIAFDEQLEIIDLEEERERAQKEIPVEDPEKLREDTVCDLVKGFIMPQVVKEINLLPSLSSSSSH